MSKYDHDCPVCGAAFGGSMRAEVVNEIDLAQARFGDFASMHEAYGVLAEEVAELFEAVRMKQHASTGLVPLLDGKTRADCIREEAIQVAAVALRIAEQAGRVTR